MFSKFLNFIMVCMGLMVLFLAYAPDNWIAVFNYVFAEIFGLSTAIAVTCIVLFFYFAEKINEGRNKLSNAALTRLLRTLIFTFFTLSVLNFWSLSRPLRVRLYQIFMDSAYPDNTVNHAGFLYTYQTFLAGILAIIGALGALLVPFLSSYIEKRNLRYSFLNVTKTTFMNFCIIFPRAVEHMGSGQPYLCQILSRVSHNIDQQRVHWALTQAESLCYQAFCFHLAEACKFVVEFEQVAAHDRVRANAAESIAIRSFAVAIETLRCFDIGKTRNEFCARDYLLSLGQDYSELAGAVSIGILHRSLLRPERSMDST